MIAASGRARGRAAGPGQRSGPARAGVWSATGLALAAWAAALAGSAPARAGERLVSYARWGGPDEIEMVRGFLAEFEAARPGVRTKLIVPSGDYYSKLQTMMAGGIPPDVMFMSGGGFVRFRDKGVLLDLTPYVRRDPGMARDLDEDFYPIVVKAFTHETRLLALPYAFNPFVIYYNRALFDKAGLPYPTNDWDWDTFLECAKRLTRDSDGDGRIDEFGYVYYHWIDPIAVWIWQAGGSILNEDRTRCVVDGPEAVEAVQFVRDLLFRHRVAVTPASAPGQDPGQMFMAGRVAMVGPIGRWAVREYRKIAGFEWDVVMVPKHPRTGLRTTGMHMMGLAVSARSRTPELAYELAKFLTDRERQAVRSRLGETVPTRRSVAESPAFVDPRAAPASDRVFLDAIPHIRLTPYMPFWIRMYDLFNSELEGPLRLDEGGTADALRGLAAEVNGLIEREREEESYPPVPRWVVIALAALALAGAGAIAARGWWARAGGRLARRRARAGYLFISPWLAGLLLFTLGPILVSLFLSLCRWNGIGPIGEARFVGLRNYARAFAGDPLFWRSLAVTVTYTVMAVPLSLCVALALALLLERPLRGIGVFRTIYYLPAVLSGVAVATLWWWVFNKSYGVLNYVLSFLGIEGPDWLGSPEWVLPSFVTMSLWGVGGPTIIFLAGLQAIPDELYEAAKIDGAGAFQRLRSVTLPLLSPAILFNLIMGIIGSFQVFTQSYVMTGGGPRNASLFYVLHLWRQAFEYYDMGYACALAWVLFVAILGATLAALRVSQRYVYYEGAPA